MRYQSIYTISAKQKNINKYKMIKGYNIYIYYNMDEVFKQAPDGLTYEEVETIFIRNDNNVLDTLIELWKIPEKNVNNISEEESKWANIRATCDDFDNEMKKVLDSAKKHS